ncbi:MAG: hypothetical protein HQL20_08020 [Candidatus Omnitrophica bacterium]|nr:hypothetical protein [Candidatus Omnitrophota bacterium]
MNKIFVVILSAVLLVALCIWFCPCRRSMTCASQGMMGKSGRMGCQINGKGPKGQMRGQGMEGMLDKEVLLTPDGGLFVVVGNKIVKYDQDLNVVKEVEVMAGAKLLPNEPMGIKKGCPMMKGGLRSEDVDKTNPVPVKK